MEAIPAATSHEAAAPGLASTTKRAAIYARVSTDQQVNRDRSGGDGFSIPAQCELCRRKASELGAEVVAEYIDKGQSARSADRPQLQAMLERIKTLRDVDYVIVHKVDRLARNRMDDAVIHFEIIQAGAQLVSVAESIDETPPGMLLHGIMAVIAEYGSNNHSTEVRKGLDRKARSGGTLGRAPIGYLNKREITGRSDMRWVEIDPERSDHVRWAFETYATGEFGLTKLTEELAARGLVTIETARCPARPLHRSHVNELLHNPYYIGIITYKGVQYPGNHQPLVDIPTFTRVQAVMEAHSNGEKQRTHRHYLRSTLVCARCGSRMAFTRAKGNGGEYDYFFCLGRHQRRTECTLPFVAADAVETSVENYYRDHIALSAEVAEQLAARLSRALQTANRAAKREVATQRRRLANLENRRRKLLDAYEAGAVPIDLLRERQEIISAEVANANNQVERANVQWENVERNLFAAYALAASCAATYRRAKPARRRGMNQAFFENIRVDADGPARVPRIAEADLVETFDRLLDPTLQERLGVGIRNPGQHSFGQGLKESEMVEVMGLEPTTSTLRT